MEANIAAAEREPHLKTPPPSPDSTQPPAVSSTTGTAASVDPPSVNAENMALTDSLTKGLADREQPATADPLDGSMDTQQSGADEAPMNSYYQQDVPDRTNNAGDIRNTHPDSDEDHDSAAEDEHTPGRIDDEEEEEDALDESGGSRRSAALEEDVQLKERDYEVHMEEEEENTRRTEKDVTQRNEVDEEDSSERSDEDEQEDITERTEEDFAERDEEEDIAECNEDEVNPERAEEGVTEHIEDEEENISERNEEEDNAEQVEEDVADRIDDVEEDITERTEDDIVDRADAGNAKESPTEPASSTTTKKGKRWSPWREPRDQLPLPAKDSPHKVLKKKKWIARRRLLSDSVVVSIPLGVTADLGVALKRTRERRVEAIYEQFPNLKPEEPKKVDEGDEAMDDDGDASERPSDKGENKKKRQKLKHVPQPHEYSSVLDYLEAKYVQGVMVGDDEEASDEEGQGSVYSETSFLDDTGLQRTVAEQVMGHVTTTKMELQNDDEYFVNVGDLEVEETDLTKHNYDPLQDTDGKKPPRKRKKAEPKQKDPKAAAKAAAKNPEKENASPAKKKTKPTPKEELKMKSETANPAAAKKKADSTDENKIKDPSILKLKKLAMESNAIVDDMYVSLVEQVKAFTEEDLPRKEKPKKTKVALQVPKDKKAGDMITFANPHVPGQKLKVRIPDNTEPGGTFRVTVPKPPDEDEVDNKDRNKIGRDFYYKLDDFARSYDEWCDLEAPYRKAIGDDSFGGAHIAKRNKFDMLATEFPADLKTPVDKAYLQKVLRRARQSKQKRGQTKVRQLQNPNHPPVDDSGSELGHESDDDGPKLARSPATAARTIMAPPLSRIFSKRKFDLRDFEVPTKS